MIKSNDNLHNSVSDPNIDQSFLRYLSSRASLVASPNVKKVGSGKKSILFKSCDALPDAEDDEVLEPSRL